MRRTILGLLVVGLLACFGTPTIAEDTVASNQTANDPDPTTIKKPAKSARQTNPAQPCQR